MRFGSLSLAAAATLALGACSTDVTTVGQQFHPYSPAHGNYAMNGRDTFVIVQGGGYGAEQTAFRQAVLDTMQKSRAGLNTRFTATPQNNPNKDYKVVMLFNGPVTAKASELCSRPEQYASVTPMVGSETHVLAAFCQFDSPLTQVSGRAAGVTTLADARFTSLIRQTMTDLFPKNDEDSKRDGGGSGDSFP